MEKLRTLITVELVVLLCGCSHPMDDYKNTVRNGIKSVPHVQEITEMFPGAPIDHFITQYGFDKNAPVMWNTVAYIYGRYELGYQVYVMVDYKKNQVSKVVGAPKIYLWEVAPNHPIVGTFTSSHTISENDWKKVIAAKGDFSVIGIHLITNSPVAGFDDYVSSWHKDRVQVGE
jgi:hypothetical protein